MPRRAEKARGHAEHLLDRFVVASARFSLLEPMLFEQRTVDKWGSGAAATGFRFLQFALLESTILEITKLLADEDARTASVPVLMNALEDVQVTNELRDAFALNIPVQDRDPGVRQLLADAGHQEANRRRSEFDDLVMELRERWASLQASTKLTSMVRMRDKMIAHNEVRLREGNYQPLDVKELDLQLGDIGALLTELRALADLITTIFRNSDYDFQSLEAQLRKMRSAFWRADG